ncbi:MAG TPA: hypothetical protein DD434_04635 [Bacteroidales bacterium]|nr:hypothetical protein [Bacteroidales bacterium]
MYILIFTKQTFWKYFFIFVRIIVALRFLIIFYSFLSIFQKFIIPNGIIYLNISLLIFLKKILLLYALINFV